MMVSTGSISWLPISRIPGPDHWRQVVSYWLIATVHLIYMESLMVSIHKIIEQ